MLILSQKHCICDTKTCTAVRTVKSVLIVTRMGYAEGVFASFRALADSQGAARIGIEGEYESEPEDIAADGQISACFGGKCRISARTLNR